MFRPVSLIKGALDKGLFHLLSSNFVVQFMGFGLVLFLTKFLTQSELGELKLIQSYAAIFIAVGTFGYNSTILKVCSESVTENQRKSDFRYAVKKVIMASLISLGLFIVFAQFFYAGTVKLSNWMSLYAVVIPFAALGTCFFCYLQSLKLVKRASKVQLYVRLIFIAVIFLSANWWGMDGVIWSTILSYMVGFIFYLKYIPKGDIKGTSQPPRKLTVNKYALFIFIGALITIASQHADIFLLDFLKVEKSQIGLYTIASIFFLAGTVITGTIQTVITPYFSEKQDNAPWVKNKAIKYQIIVSLVSVVSGLALYTGGWLMVKYYYGAGYEMALPLIGILIIKFFVWANYSVIGACLFAVGIIKEGVFISAVSSISSFVAGYFFYQKFGIYGVAWGQVFAGSISLVLIYCVFHYKLESEKFDATT